MTFSRLVSGVLVCALILQVLRGLFVVNPRELSGVYDGRVVVEGLVVSTRSGSEQKRMVLEDLVIGKTKEVGRLLVRVPSLFEVQPGDRVRLSCKLISTEQAAPASYRRYLESQHIVGSCSTFEEPVKIGSEQYTTRAFLWRLRGRLLHAIEQTFHEPSASLLAGLLLGDASMPEAVSGAFRRAGLSHIVVASGQNVMMVWFFLFGLVVRMGLRRRGALVLSSIGIIAYVIMAGADPPLVRAAIMALAATAGKMCERIPSALNLLLLAALLILLQDPLTIFHAGFHLSFAATAGLLFLEPLLRPRLSFIPEWGSLRTTTSLSLAATLATLPVAVFFFEQVSVIGLVSNVLILPFVMLAITLGFVSSLSYFITPSLSPLLSAPAAGVLEIIWRSTGLLAELPLASVSISKWWSMVLAAALLFLIRRLLQRSKPKGEPTPGFSPWFLLPFAILPLIADLLPPRSSLWTLDVEQGDAHVLQLPNRRVWLIDGGPDASVLLKLGQLLPWYKRTIDVSVLTHADADHAVGLAHVASRYRVGEILTSYPDTTSSSWRHVTKHGIPITQLRKGDRRTDDGLVIDVLYPPADLVYNQKKRNNTSLVFVATLGELSILMTGDVPGEGEQEIATKWHPLNGDSSRVDILKVAHHGSKYSTTPELLSATRPFIATISVGAKNTYGHPTKAVLDRLKQFGVTTLRTDIDGDIRIQTKERVLTHALLY